VHVAPDDTADLERQVQFVEREQFEADMINANQDQNYSKAIEIFRMYAGKITVSESGEIVCQRESLLTTLMLNNYIHALVHLGQIQEVEKAIALFRSASEDSRPNQTTYALLLRAYIESLNLRKARSLLREMVDRGIRLDGRVISTILQGEGKWAVSLDSIDSVFNLILSGDFGTPNIMNFNIVIQAYLRRNRTHEAQRVLETIVSSGLKPNQETFHGLLQYKARGEGSKAVEAILRSMRKLKLTPQISHLNFLISALAGEKETLLEEVIPILSEYNNRPNVATCNIILKQLIYRRVDVQILQDHFNQMNRLNIKPDAYTFSNLLNHPQIERRGNSWKQLQQIIQDQLLLNPKLIDAVPSNIVRHVTIRKLSKLKRLTPEFQSQVRSIQPRWDLHSITSLVSSYHKTKDWDKIINLWRDVCGREIKLDRRFYKILHDALLEGQKFDLCYEVTAVLCNSDDKYDKAFGLELNIRTSRTIYRSSGQRAQQVMSDIDAILKFTDKHHIALPDSRCNLAALAFLEIDHPNLAIQLLESRYHGQGRFVYQASAKEMGYSSWVILLRAYARGGSDAIQGMRSCVERALADKSEVPSKAFTRFLHYLSNSRNLDMKDQDYFREKYAVASSLRRPLHEKRPFKKGRVTRNTLLGWVNDLDGEELETKLQKQKSGDARNNGIPCQ
jgi:pentatricopeptide repeat protein